MNKIALVGIIAALLVVAGIWYVNSNDEVENPEAETTETNGDGSLDTTTDEEVENSEVEDGSGDNAEAEVEGEVKEFVVTGANFSFDPAEIRVNEGDTVRIVFQSGDMMHDWVIDEFGVATEVLPAGEEQTIEFVADQAGEFEYYCSVGQHRAQGMVGTLIVE